MFREMRRKKQELSKEECIDILQTAKTAVLGVVGDNGYPYTVPINFVYANDKIYFHGAKNGHKIDAINKCNKVSLCIVDKDDVVEVKDGYGRNYLIPTGKAVIANAAALKVLAENQRQRAHKIAQLKAEAEEMAAKLKDVKLTLSAKTSETGTIFGSVGAAQIAEALEAQGLTVDRKIIEIKQSVKEVGNYVANVKLHKEVLVEVPFEVVSE